MSSTRSRILETARRLITEQGPRVSMADVARAAGISRQAVYLHFGSRASLLVAVVRDMDERDGIRARCERALTGEEPVEAFRAFLRAWLRYAATIHPVASVLLASRRDDPDAAAAWNDRMGELHEGFLLAARRLGTAGRLRPGLAPDVAADLAWAMTSVPVWEQLTADRGRSADEVEEHLVGAVIAALTGDPPPEAARG
ncbi:TetR/AcrR family transcriptional regulator [Planomonospora sp. ID82291]|uniref:TetR/AcrR family transcriptional regulator n=1 Tax=Planomonospora sp. ID82291 TaxID=2738136 RepID=UPI0018C37C11|nr:TetR/AcrR family transcriptional regulator [Planomonospora sp. ID82291]MBG0816917.1 TetR/AcrR family transcriptional regulator [Planomonospora sp. ID82291]